jgi:hypothetical protein
MLDTAASYITEARRLLQDEVEPYRYPDADMLAALNQSAFEARRLRPELFLGRFDALPQVTAPEDPFLVDPMYRSAILYYVVGRMELRDSEDTKDGRASVLLNKFVAQLLTIQS